MKYVVATLLLLATAFLGCTSSTEPTSLSDDYYPTTRGSSWTYQGKIWSSPDTVYTMTIWSVDSSYFGPKYTMQTTLNNGIPDWGYFLYKENDKVYFYMGDSIGYVNNLVYDFSTNATWSLSLYQHVGKVITRKCTSAERGLTRTVKGKTYSDVLHINVEETITESGKDSSYHGDMYLAKGVGLIERTGTFDGFAYLLDHTIK